jgi:hypothetical protein
MPLSNVLYLRANFLSFSAIYTCLPARAQGFAVSDATVGRIIKSLVDRGVVLAAPSLRRRRPRWSAKRRFAVRLPRDLKPDKPGGLKAAHNNTPCSRYCGGLRQQNHEAIARAMAIIQWPR